MTATGEIELDWDVTELVAEVARYLAGVDAFRAAGAEPEWVPESTQSAWQHGPPRLPPTTRPTQS